MFLNICKLVINIKRMFSNKAFLIELFGFVFLQIFLDVYRTFFESKYEIFGIALPELINLLYLAMLTVVFVVKNIKKPKLYIPIGVYAVFAMLYLGFHIVNILKFNQEIFTGSELNWFKELYFIIRTYMVPILVFYYFLCSDIKGVHFNRSISILSLIISVNIILTNIFKVSFICYASSLEKNSFITRNVFEWFYNPDVNNPSFMTSKGWFYMGNQIGLILLMLFVFVIMNAFESGKISSFVVAFLNAVAMILVGTKVSTLGCIIVLAVGLVFAIVFGIALKQFNFKLKQGLLYVLMIILCVALVSHSPMFSLQENREAAYETTEEQQKVKDSLDKEFEDIKQKEEEKKEDNKKEDNKKGQSSTSTKLQTKQFKKKFSEYVSSYPYFFGIHPEFVELFPVEENFDFWYEIAINGNNQQINYRYLKTLIYNEAIKVNNNVIADRLFGTGYVSNFPYSESDFISQNIWFGYVGTALLIGPYFLVILYGIIIALKNFKTCFVYQNAFFALAIGLATVLSVLAGHLFYGVFSITIFAFISAGFFKFQTERHKAK